MADVTTEFQLTRPSRGVTCDCGNFVELCTFQLTRPSRGVTGERRFYDNYRYISTHTPLAGRDKYAAGKTGEDEDFNSHAPRGA